MKKFIVGIAATLTATIATAAIAASASTDADTNFTYDDYSGWYTAQVEVSQEAPQTIGLDGVPAGKYVLSAQANAYPAPVIYAALGNSAKVELTENEYMFGELTGDFTIAEGDTQFTISTEYTELVEVYVTLHPVLEQAALPTTEETKTEFTLWANYEFQYTHKGETGFYTMTPSVTGAEFGIEMKSNPVYYTGETISDANYPVKLVQNETYYFSIALTGLPADTPEDVNSVEAYFTFASWTPTALVYSRNTFVLVTPASETPSIVKIDPTDLVPNSKYAVNLFEMVGTSITAHFVKADNSEALTPITSTTGVFEFEYTADIDGVYFTTEATETFATRAYLGYAAAESQDIALGEHVSITIRPNETIPAEISGMTVAAANYNITISSDNVTVSGSTGDIIPQGQTAAMFPILRDYITNEYIGTALYLTNNGTETVILEVLVEMSGTDYNLEADTVNEVTVAPQSKTTYFVPALTAGNYLITLTGANNIAVYDYFNSYAPIAYGANGRGLYNLTLGEEVESATVAFTIENTGADSVTFTFEIKPVDTLTLNTENALNVTGTKDYYMGNLETGRYLVSISDMAYGTEFTVSFGGRVIVSNEKINGYFTVEVPEGYRHEIGQFTIAVTGDATATFTLTVTEAVDGAMYPGVAKEITLGENDTTETYNITLMAETKYRVTLEGVPEGVTVYVTINGSPVLYSGNTVDFELDRDATSVQFTYFSFETVTSFTFTVTITEVVSE